jgi:hypothetical protein
MKVLTKKEQDFVVKLIEDGKTINEIINLFNKKNGRIIGNSTIRRIAYKYKVSFAQGGLQMTPEQAKFLKVLILKKHTKSECQRAMVEKFDRTLNKNSVQSFAKRLGLKMQGVYKSPEEYTEEEIKTIRGLWLVKSGEKRMISELPSRSLRSMRRKIQYINTVGGTADSIKEAVERDLKNGKSYESISKKYKIDKKYLKEYGGNFKESSVQIENLKRWEKMDVDAILDHIESGQKRLRSLDSEQGNADITIKTSNKYIALTFLSDFHLENVNTDIGQLRRDFATIKNTKDFYMGFGGDLIDNFMVGPHKEGVVEAVIPPKAARLAAGKLFDELKGKVLWTIIGCHDAWDRDYADYNLPEHIARKQEIPYLGHGGDVNLTIKNHKSKVPVLYNIHARHKFRGGSGLGNGTACCKNVLRDIDSKFDIVSIGHNHFAEIKLEHYLGKLRVFIRNGSYKREDRYSKMLGYQANDFNIQIPVVILNTQTKEIKVVSGIKNAAESLVALNKK